MLSSISFVLYPWIEVIFKVPEIRELDVLIQPTRELVHWSRVNYSLVDFPRNFLSIDSYIVHIFPLVDGRKQCRQVSL